MKRCLVGRAWVVAALVCAGLSLCGEVAACTTLMAGRKATADGAVLMSSSCDGDIMGLIYVMPANEYPVGTKLPMYWNLPRPRNIRMLSTTEFGHIHGEILEILFEEGSEFAKVVLVRNTSVGRVSFFRTDVPDKLLYVPTPHK